MIFDLISRWWLARKAPDEEDVLDHGFKPTPLEEQMQVELEPIGEENDS